MKLGNGLSVAFWQDRWSGPFKLVDRFNRLLRLDPNKDALNKDKGEFVDGVWQWKLVWRRPLRGRDAGDQDELLRLLDQVQPRMEQKDSYKWWLSSNGSFSIECLRKELDRFRLGDGISSFNSEVCRLVTKKVSVFIWKVKHGKLLVRQLLDNLGIDLHSTLCPRCDDVVESIDHALIKCLELKSLWHSFFNWWGVEAAEIEILNFDNPNWWGVEAAEIEILNFDNPNCNAGF